MNKKRYSVLIVNWPVKGSYKVKAFQDYDSAERMIEKFILAHSDMSDNVLIIDGEIVKIGFHDKPND